MTQLKEYLLFSRNFNKVGDVCGEKKKEPFAEQDVAQDKKEVVENRESSSVQDQNISKDI